MTGITKWKTEDIERPLHWRKPRHAEAMSDLFHEQVPDDFVDRAFAVMALCPPHVFQVLTKRPERMRDYMQGDVWGYESPYPRIDEWAGSINGESGVGVVTRWPLPNVWLGVSAEDQRNADERIPLLLDTPAAVRFLSCEPLLGPVDLNKVHPGTVHSSDFVNQLDWVIVGGESGPGARPCDLTWVRDIVRQCQEAGVAVFVKQLGSRPVGLPLGDVWRGMGERPQMRLRDRKGSDPAEWPADLRIREFPVVQR